ncbi:MAG: L7Ae/L30e/S12e/Gadd45 family ribosomal protein [Lachnospirales bacterium]
MNRNVRSMLSLARRANAIKTGEFAVSETIVKKSAKIVVVAKDSGNNTKKKFSNSCHFYGVKLYSYSLKSEISSSIGKNNVAVFSIEDINFANRIEELILADETDKEILDDYDYRQTKAVVHEDVEKKSNDVK